MTAILKGILFIVRVITWPLRVLSRVFFGGNRAVTTARKAAGSVIAAEIASDERVRQLELPKPLNLFPFKALDRPRLAEQNAADLDLETAISLVSRADRFYMQNFELFPRGNLFYEEVEIEELAYALSADDQDSTDARFVVWMTLFRRTLNDNARRLLMIYAPAIFALLIGSAVWAMAQWPTMTGLPGLSGVTVPSCFVIMPAVTVLGLFALVLIYQWPFKVIIQRNLLGLDNYITSRFSRINQNFQVAKRFALNVERNKRMSQAEELKHEAGIWTVAYNWLAMRLFLGERIVRNQMYQVNRNAALYAIGGVSLCIMLAIAALSLWGRVVPEAGLGPASYMVFIGCTVVYLFMTYVGIVGGAAGEASRVLSDNEWFRFGDVDLDKTIADHVGEDKLQIVTFRDRNRIE